MCGIVGYISNKKKDLTVPLNSIKHRGPDASGQYSHFRNGAYVGLGHVRLSIIDLSAGANQPFRISGSNCSIIFNGEIYNYKLLRCELELKGRVFYTNSDTEVLLSMYLEYGMEMLNRLSGIFAFCIFDENIGSLFVARDQLGIKPLYYSVSENSLFFASEIKALFSFPSVIRQIDPYSITEFLLNGFVYEPHTGFENILKVLPGHYIEINFSNNVLTTKNKCYWMPTVSSNTIYNEQLLFKSIEEQLISDVPVGLFFSGGVDSSIILGTLRDKIDAFVLKSSEGEYFESGMSSDYMYATKISDLLNVNLNEIQIADNQELSGDELLNYIQILSTVTEEPVADFTFIASQVLSKATRERGYKVILSGMGADEIFAGYSRYRMVRYKSIYQKVKWIINVFLSKTKFFSKKVERFNSFLNETDFIFSYTQLIGVFSLKEVRKMLIVPPNLKIYHEKLTSILNEYKSCSKMKQSMLLDRYGFLSHNFLVADKSSMLEGVELRVPLATKELFQAAFNLPDCKLVNFKKGKLPLRKILYKILPKGIVDRRKTGFNPPLDKAIRDLGQKKCFLFMDENGLFNYINQNYVDDILKDHYTNSINNTYKIFNLLYLSEWLKFNK